MSLKCRFCGAAMSPAEIDYYERYLELDYPPICERCHDKRVDESIERLWKLRKRRNPHVTKP